MAREDNGEPQQGCTDNAHSVGNIEDADSDLEYSALNEALDEISSCLDVLEQKNEVLREEFSKLLESNQHTRIEFQQQASNVQKKTS